MDKNTPNLAFDSGIILIGGGDLTKIDVGFIKSSNYPIICADAGYYRAVENGLMPVAIIGDLDSIEPEKIEIPCIFVDDQNNTDFDKCLELLSASYLLCFGFQGGRLDHSLAVLNGLTKNKRTPAFVITDQDVCALCPPYLALNVLADKRFSVFPMVASTAKSTGLLYPLDGVDLNPIGRVGTSNKTNADALTVDIETGCLLVIFERDLLQSVLAQWPNARAKP